MCRACNDMQGCRKGSVADGLNLKFGDSRLTIACDLQQRGCRLIVRDPTGETAAFINPRSNLSNQFALFHDLRSVASSRLTWQFTEGSRAFSTKLSPMTAKERAGSAAPRPLAAGRSRSPRPSVTKSTSFRSTLPVAALGVFRNIVVHDVEKVKWHGR